MDLFLVSLAEIKVENRTDVAIFTSQPFAEDTAVVGNIKVRLFVSR